LNVVPILRSLKGWSMTAQARSRRMPNGWLGGDSDHTLLGSIAPKGPTVGR